MRKKPLVRPKNKGRKDQVIEKIVIRLHGRLVANDRAAIHHNRVTLNIKPQTNLLVTSPHAFHSPRKVAVECRSLRGLSLCRDEPPVHFHYFFTNGKTNT